MIKERSPCLAGNLNSNWHQFTRIQSKCALATMSCQRSCLSWHTCGRMDAGHSERKKYEAKRCSSDNKSRLGMKAPCLECRAIDIVGRLYTPTCVLNACQVYFDRTSWTKASRDFLSNDWERFGQTFAGNSRRSRNTAFPDYSERDVQRYNRTITGENLVGKYFSCEFRSPSHASSPFLARVPPCFYSSKKELSCARESFRASGLIGKVKKPSRPGRPSPGTPSAAKFAPSFRVHDKLAEGED